MIALGGTKHVTLAMRGDGVGLLTIDRPPVNALGRDLVADLNTACAALEQAPAAEARAIVVVATGTTFCAGADLKERRTMSEEDVRRWVPYLSGTFTRIARLPMPTIAVVQGVAAGGGLELALACDLRIAEEPARLGLREVALGIIPGAGGTQRLPRLAGAARAKKWILLARMFQAAEALSDGVVDAVTPAGRGAEAGLALAAEIAGNAPLAVRAAKRALDEGSGLRLEAGLDAEWRAYASILPTEDRLEALAAFAAKRKPEFKGR